jgi:hypothetical protein
VELAAEVSCGIEDLLKLAIMWDLADARHGRLNDQSSQGRNETSRYFKMTHYKLDDHPILISVLVVAFVKTRRSAENTLHVRLDDGAPGPMGFDQIARDFLAQVEF